MADDKAKHPKVASKNASPLRAVAGSPAARHFGGAFLVMAGRALAGRCIGCGCEPPADSPHLCEECDRHLGPKVEAFLARFGL